MRRCGHWPRGSRAMWRDSNLLTLGLGTHAINARLRNGFVRGPLPRRLLRGPGAPRPTGPHRRRPSSRAVPRRRQPRLGRLPLWSSLATTNPPRSPSPKATAAHAHPHPSLPVVRATRHHPPTRRPPPPAPLAPPSTSAPRLTSTRRSRLVNDGRLNGYLRLTALCEVLQRNPYHPGTRLLTPFGREPPQPTRSPFEDEFLAFIAKYDLPTPQINVHVNGRRSTRTFRRPSSSSNSTAGTPTKTTRRSKTTANATPTTSTTATAPSASPNSASGPSPTTRRHASSGSSTARRRNQRSRRARRTWPSACPPAPDPRC